MIELSIVDICFTIWAGVATALYFATRKELDRCKYMTVRMLYDLHEGNVELVKTADGEGLTIKEKNK